MTDLNCIMLVDDNETDNFIHTRLLELLNFSSKLVVKNNGKAALDYLKENEHNPENIPDLIFLDLNMPIVDGFVFLHEFEELSEEVLSKSKVVVLSSSDNEKDYLRLVDNEHVIKFIKKPLTEASLNSVNDVI